ncbi:protein-disulfide reductase DsbD family protein [Sphingomonas flavescens]|uniref:protein-disulfide reductase DsbD family protein n=1 Tax=Sphingomonas flavescens TaxID=3132797 RepID=UPI002804FA94|nr:protein-disulfide reductase DsbD domain-containing protein [Sphingomonas limnosediminicola]
MIRRLLLLLCLLLAPAAAGAQHIVPQLVAEGAAPPGGEVELAIHMRPERGWHGYWRNPGDAGLPMTVDWRLPPGFSAGPLSYPVPTRLTVAGLMNYVFERDYAVLVRLKVPANATGTIPVRAAATWLACTDKICVPERGELSLDVPVGQGTPNRAQFDAWRQALPQPLATPAHFAVQGNRLRVAIPLPASVAVAEPYLFPITDDVFDYEAPQQFRRSGDWVVAELTTKASPHTFEGVLALKDGRGLEFRAVQGPVPSGGEVIGGGALGAQAIFWAVLGALAGGILLNLMPCVFPILALKALHLSRAGGSQREARSDALSYAAGAVIGTGALGAVLLIIRAAGAQAGWAFQLQDPRTIMLLMLLAVVITANLLGLFELPVLGGRAQPAGSFGTGVLAAFVATPCAGPFLGAALGTALLLPPAGSLAVFAALGLGLALPFVAVAFVPALRTKLPKPGPWMDRLKRLLAVPMVASAIAALWLVYRLGGPKALALGALSAIALIALLIWIGRRQRRGVATGLPAIAAIVGLVAASAVAANTIPVEAQAERAGSAEKWSEVRVAALAQQGKPVFVYFTADWCLTCKVNEAAAIDRAEVRDAFKRAGVTVLEGDWTNGDPAITRFLETRGRAGVPYYLWYAPGKPPEELPQVLTPSMLTGRAQAAKR